MKPINERRIVYDILFEVKKKNKSCAVTIDNIFISKKCSELTSVSKKFITNVAYGTIENIILIDYYLSKLLTRPINKVNPSILIILELSAYQILCADNIPESAAVNEAVKLTEELGMVKLKGFVNGVLRNLIRKKDEIQLPSEDNYKDFLSVKYSIQKDILDIWENALKNSDDSEVESLDELARNTRDSKKIYIRINTEKSSEPYLAALLEDEGVDVDIAPKYYDDSEKGMEMQNDLESKCLSISNFDSLRNLESFKDGLFYVQDLSSILSYENVRIEDGAQILDMCASPGGKSIGAYLNVSEYGNCTITARDKTKAKAAAIKENIKRLGIQGITAEVKDACEYYEDDFEKYDVVIADVPCSGLGVISKKPDINMHFKRSGIKELLEIQKKIIDNAVKYLKSGGKLIYSTCTFNTEENEDNVEYILKNNDMKLDFSKQYLPTEEIHMDGFFIAIFTKE